MQGPYKLHETVPLWLQVRLCARKKRVVDRFLNVIFNRINKKGCDRCKCRRCPSMDMCTKICSNGLDFNKYGCQICKCRGTIWNQSCMQILQPDSAFFCVQIWRIVLKDFYHPPSYQSFPLWQICQKRWTLSTLVHASIRLHPANTMTVKLGVAIATYAFAVAVMWCVTLWNVLCLNATNLV